MEKPKSQVGRPLSGISLSVCSPQVPDLSLLRPALSPQDSGTGPSREQELSQARPQSSGVRVPRRGVVGVVDTGGPTPVLREEEERGVLTDSWTAPSLPQVSED